MPLKSRLDASGVLHHVIIRGIERNRIFWGDSDKDDLLDRLLYPGAHGKPCPLPFALRPEMKDVPSIPSIGKEKYYGYTRIWRKNTVGQPDK
jgi:hypothetical protein